ncbi:MAG: caspase family protein [Prevotellaceae bacterium]|jgi:hypothetical protein|nr:caspase family protein [Prevotellaceae bacterium]
MKKMLFLALFALVATTGIAQKDKTIIAELKKKYDYVLYSKDHGGWYGIVSNEKAGACDLQGNEIIPCKYDKLLKHDKYFVFKLNDKWGAADLQGNEIIPPVHKQSASLMKTVNQLITDEIAQEKQLAEEKLLAEEKRLAEEKQLAEEKRLAEEKAAYKKTFEDYIRNYVQNAINTWQKKGEFEKTSDWQDRVNETTRKVKAAELLKAAEQAFIAEHSSNLSLGNMTLGEYDADNEVYLIQNDKYGDLLVPVPVAEAKLFKTQWKNIRKTPQYFIENADIALASMSFAVSDGKSYTYSNQASLNYTRVNIDYNFDPIDISIASAPSAPKSNQKISEVQIQAGTKADVDMNIPTSSANNDKTFAVIIANEDYHEKEISNVEFAATDGEMFKEYCTKTLGIPATNVHYKVNATLNHIRSEINWLTQVAKSYKGEANFIFYYAGHGIPDEASKTAYLLPVDGYGSDVKSGYSLDDLYAKLGDMPAQSVIVFLDACFSGPGRDGSMLASARGVATKTKSSTPTGNMVVFSAASGDETAYPYKEKGHGLFTYYLLKKLQESKGDVTLGELSSYISTNVSRQSIVVNSKSQTPTVVSAPSLTSKWQNMKLRITRD